MFLKVRKKYSEATGEKKSNKNNKTMNISKKAILSFIVALTSVVSMAQPYYHIMKEENGKLIEETAYNGKKYNIKIDMEKHKPKDAIGGKITIESTWKCSMSPLKRSFYFTKHGNVYYNKSEDKFHFESSQLDYPSGSYNYNHVGHFHWDRTIDGCIKSGSWGATFHGGETTFYFANPAFLEKLQEDLGNEKWAVLSACEWEYVCETLGEYGWKVDGKTCFLIDATPGKSLLNAIRNENGGKKTLTKAQFEAYEAQGLVCLPASGVHYDKAMALNVYITSYWSGQGSYGYYWSCTPSLTNDIAAVDKSSRPGTWYMSFVSNKAGVSHGAVRGDGFAVRLVILADD